MFSIRQNHERKNVLAVPEDVTVAERRALVKATYSNDRSDISEELQRLEGHLQQFGELIVSSHGPVGKRLDFLSQEVLRELNTLGSKARDLQLTREVLEMKSEIEKVREQVQNVE